MLCKKHELSCLVVHLDGHCSWKDEPCTCEKKTLYPMYSKDDDNKITTDSVTSEKDVQEKYGEFVKYYGAMFEGCRLACDLIISRLTEERN